MAEQNVPLLAFNRGIISTKALARVDVDRTRLSAEVMTNWLPKTQGAMTIAPGTKYFGSSLNDTGAEYIEFVASTNDVALLELTDEKMRIWQSTDAHNVSLLGRPKVDTVLTIADTGWSDVSTGGSVATPQVDIIPDMGAETTANVQITASSNESGASFGGEPWRVGSGSTSAWQDTGEGSTLPSWLNIDLDAGSSDTGEYAAVTSYSVTSPSFSSFLARSPKAWRFLASNFDTGTYATDTGKWALVDERTAETGWSISEKRTYTRADADTGSIEAQRHWRLHFTKVDDANDTGRLQVQEVELFTAASAQQVKLSGGRRVFNASAIGSLAKLQKHTVVDTGDVDLEHSLDINVARGPLVMRCGSSAGADDYISETTIGTGYHNLAFTPSGDFHITVQSDALVDRIIQSLTVGDSGTVEVTSPWTASDLDNLRYDQSADVVYVDCSGVKPYKIERRGTGRSWSAVEYAPRTGPFLGAASSTAKLSVSHFYGNTTMNSNIPFFKTGHVGALMKLFHNGQSGKWALGALNAITDAIEVTGISDTGAPTSNSERRVNFSVAGAWAGTATIERSFDGPDFGFKPLSSQVTVPSDTGTFSKTVDDPDDNISVWYRVKATSYTSGVAVVTVTYKGGGVNGIARINGFNSSTDVDIEVLSRFSDTGETDSWQEGSWSATRGYPSSTKLHGGRLFHAGGANIYGSVSDDFENFDETTEGDAGPILKTLGSGPVDNIYYLVSLLRLIIGTSGAEMAVRSSSIDEPLTPTNSNARQFSTQGSANIRALKLDTRAIFVQRSRQRVFLVGFGEGIDALGDYSAQELTMFVPDLLKLGVVSMAIQRQPDTRIHFALAGGKVAILTYEPQEDVLCWSMWETDGSVERVMSLPGTGEDAVYYHINRTINGSTKRYLEKWALEEECAGDTGLSWLMHCAASYSDTGKVTTADAWGHLVGESVVAWGDDTGQTNAGRDLSPDDTGGDPKLYTVDTGGGIDISGTYAPGVHHLVAGLPYTADWKSTKLAYAAQFGTALSQLKRSAQMAVILHQTHNNGLQFGSDTGYLDPLPRVTDEGERVDANKIFTTFDQKAIPFDGTYDADSRIHIRARAPRPATLLAAIPTIKTSEKV